MLFRTDPAPRLFSRQALHRPHCTRGQSHHMLIHLSSHLLSLLQLSVPSPSTFFQLPVSNTPGIRRASLPLVYSIYCFDPGYRHILLFLHTQPPPYSSIHDDESAAPAARVPWRQPCMHPLNQHQHIQWLLFWKTFDFIFCFLDTQSLPIRCSISLSFLLLSHEIG